MAENHVVVAAQGALKIRLAGEWVDPSSTTVPTTVPISGQQALQHATRIIEAAAPALKGCAGKFFLVVAVEISDSGVLAHFPLKSELAIPGLFITGANSNAAIRDDFGELIAAIRNYAGEDVAQAEKEARLAAITAIETARERLRGGFARVEVDVAADAFVAFGAKTIAGATGALSAFAAVRFDPILDKNLSGIVIEAGLDAAAAIGAGSKVVAAAISIRLALTGEGLLSLVPDISLPEVPHISFGFPKLGIDLPEKLENHFPNFSFDHFNSISLDRILSLSIPLPELGSSPVRIEWEEKPEFKFKLDGSLLTIITTTSPTKGKGKIVVGDGNVIIAEIKDLELTVDKNGVQPKGSITAAQSSIDNLFNNPKLFGSAKEIPFTVVLGNAKLAIDSGLTINLADPKPSFSLKVSLDLPRIEIRAKDDTNIVLAFTATYTYEINSGGSSSGALSNLELIDPYPIKLLALGGEAIVGVIRMIGAINLPGVNAPDWPEMQGIERLFDRLAAFLRACVRYLARIAGAAGRALAGLAEEAFNALAELIDLLKGASSTALSHVAIEVRLDARDMSLRQIVIAPRKSTETATKELSFAGLHLEIPVAWTPTLLFDISGPLFVGLLALPSTNKLTLSTDLWLDRDGAPSEAVRDVDTETGKRPAKRLIEVTAAQKDNIDQAIVLIACDDGQVSFLRSIGNAPQDKEDTLTFPRPGQTPLTMSILKTVERPQLISPQLKVDVAVDTSAAERLLPFFGSGGGGGDGSFVDKLGRYVKIKKGKQSASLNGPTVTLPLACEIKLDTLETDIDITLILDIETLRARIETGDQLTIRGPVKEGEIFGLTYRIEPKPEIKPVDGKFNQFSLDFSGGRPRMALAKEAMAKLFYQRIAAGGRGLVFNVSEFAVASGVFDISAAIDPQEPIMLPGVAMPFRFRAGSFAVRNGQLQDFALSGTGQLPNKLVGEAHATIALAMGRGADGRLAVKSAEAELDKTGSPIVHRGTRTTLTVTKLGLGFEDYDRDGGYQFYFKVTGSIAFTPSGNEFGSSFLSKFRKVEIKLDRAPLGGDLTLLARSIQIQVELQPKLCVSLFEIFAFELRSIGFMPRAPEFDDQPGLFIGGKVAFMEGSDVFNASIDVDKLGISPPRGDSGLPRIKFDGLSVALSLQSLGTVEGTARVVDGRMPSLDGTSALPSDVTAKGFLASGRIALKGWAPLSAAMGFLELRRGEGDWKHSFFLYGQAEALAVPIATPIIPLYLREVGFGFGYRYTFAGLARADQVDTPQALIEVLDDVSRFQGNLATFKAWQPEADGSRLTLAMRALFTVACNSTSAADLDMEEMVANPLLFDVAAALRSDATFLMTARVWLSVNYHEWFNSADRADIMVRPTLRGYLYISAPRQEILARALSDTNGYIGKKPILPELVETALKAVQWSATLYIRPGLYHVEMGWPYELKLEYDSKGTVEFGLRLEGGMVQRVEDWSYLNGIAYRGTGYARFGGEVGNDNFGAAVSARANFEISGKTITYISLKRVSDSFYYGSMYYSVSVEFSVRMWLSFKVFSRRITLRAGFSLGLTVTVLQEFVIGPSMLGARARMSIAVSAFGRTLRLSVGLAFNSGKLEEARQRVERFLALGLTAVVPDPEKGLSAPAPAAAASPATDKVIENKADLSEALSDKKPALAPGEEPKIDGDAVGHPWFWAIVTEVPAKPGTYIVQLVPRDHTAVVANLDQVDALDGTFFPPTTWATSISNLSNPGQLTRLGLEGDTPTEKPVVENELLPVNGAVPLAGSGEEKITFADVLNDNFIRTNEQESGPVGTPVEKLLQPKHQPIDARRMQMGGNGQTAEDQMRDASAAMAKLSPSQAEWGRVEERRSAFISAVMRGVTRLANEARVDSAQKLDWPGREPSSDSEMVIDPRDLGLTFVLSAKGLDDLFETGNGAQDDNNPPLSTFKLVTKGLDSAVKSRSVALFNPPSRHFANRSPRLAEMTTRPTKAGLALDWDLEPPWSTGKGTWNDPEQHLRHYELERVIQGANGRPANLPIKRAKFKAAAPLVPSLVDEKLTWQPTRPLAQFVDDFSDLPSPLREALRLDPDKFAEVQQEYLSPTDGGDGIRVAYLIVPVDVNGSRGLPIPIETFIPRPARRPVAIGRAETVIAFETLPTKGEPPKARLFLRIDDPLFRNANDKEQPARAPEQGTQYELWVRDEPATRRGLFGADALTRARQRPTPADLGEEFAIGERNRTVTLTWRHPKAQAGDKFAAQRRKVAFDFVEIVEARKNEWPDSVVEVGTDEFKKLNFLLGLSEKAGLSTEKPAPQRLIVRRMLTNIEKVKHVDSPWIVADMAIHAGPKTTDKDGRPLPKPIEAIVEVYERPFVAGWKPHDFDRLEGEAGRLMITYPGADSTLEDLTKNKGESLVSLRDGDRRVATRLRWAAAYDDDNLISSDFIGGFDLFEIDLTGIATPDDQIDVARHVGRALLLDPELAKIDPAGIDDFGQVEAFYPSESLRLADRKGPARRRPWFSTAESLGSWPAPALRRAIGHACDDGVVTPLFDRGKPKTITVKWSAETEKRIPNALEMVLGWEEKKLEWEEKKLECDGPEITNCVSVARAAIRTLKVNYGGKAMMEAASKVGQFTAMVVTLIGKSDAGYETGRSELVVDLDPPLHGYLADVLDALRWDNVNGRRRYNVVLENAPETKATSLSDLLSERPSERDPHGWAILRTLGLATGFRLFDLETGDYLAPADALRLVDAAMKKVAPAYANASLGAPFVDVLVRSGGAMRLATHDGGAPALVAADVSRIVNDEALALLQIALRPVPEHFAGGEDNTETNGVIYARATPAPGANITAQTFLDATKIPSDQLLIEVINVAGGRPAGEPILLAKGSSPFVQAVAAGRPVDLKTKLDITGVKMASDKTIAIARVIFGSGVSKTDALNYLEDLNVETTAEPHSTTVEWTLCDQPNVLGRTPSATMPPDVFERFLPLSPNAVEALLKEVPIDGSSDRLAGARHLASLAARRFPKAPKIENRDLAVQLLTTAPRYLASGAAQRPTPADKVPFAIATIPRPDPYRIKPGLDGMMETILVHKDRMARRRRYMVRAFGRYDALVESWHGAFDTKEGPAIGKALDPKKFVIPWVARRSLNDSFKSEDTFAPLPKISLPEIGNYAIDIASPRTQKLAPPVVLSARRLDTGEGTNRRPGKVLEFVVARHNEALLAEANAATHDALQFEHVAHGFYREYAHRDWALGLTGGPKPEVIAMLLEAFGAGDVSEPPEPTFVDGSFVDKIAHEALPERLPDGFRGIRVLRTREVPHFFKLHMVSFAAAGVVVSEPVVATIPEGEYELHWPWETGLTGPLTKTPTWSVTRENVSGRAPKTTVNFHIPLIRHLDGMPDADRKTWFKDQEAPFVFKLPDPGATYEIAVVKLLTRDEVADISPEVELLPRPGNGSDQGKSTLLVKASGPRFSVLDGKTDTVPFVEDGAWVVGLQLTPTAVAPITRAINSDLATAAGNLAEDIELPLGAVISFVRPVLLTNVVSQDWTTLPNVKNAVRAAIAAIDAWAPNGTKGEGLSEIKAFLERLIEIDTLEPGSWSFPMPWIVSAPSNNVRIAIDAFVTSIAGTAAEANASIKWDAPANSVVLWHPPKDEELTTLIELANNDADKKKIVDLVTAAASDQLFGPGRVPRLKATRGLLDPITDFVKRGI